VQHLPVLEQGIRYRAYPNPFDTGLTIQVPSNYLGEMSFICDLTGKVVWQGFLSSDKIHIDTSLWPPGQYYFISRKQRIPVVKAGQ
jgi:hypothetical protein